jgi:hypothetical protein
LSAKSTSKPNVTDSARFIWKHPTKPAEYMKQSVQQHGLKFGGHVMVLPDAAG